MSSNQGMIFSRYGADASPEDERVLAFKGPQGSAKAGEWQRLLIKSQ